MSKTKDPFFKKYFLFLRKQKQFEHESARELGAKNLSVHMYVSLEMLKMLKLDIVPILKSNISISVNFSIKLSFEFSNKNE